MAEKIRLDFGFVPVPRELVESSLSVHAKMVWVVLGWHADYRDFTSFPSLRRLASMSGVSLNTARKGRQELIDTGWLTSEQRKGQEGNQTNNYTLRCSTGGGGGAPVAPPLVRQLEGGGAPVAPERDSLNEIQEKKTSAVPAPIVKGDPRIKRLIDLFFETFKADKRNAGQAPTVSGRWGADLKRLLVHHDEAFIASVMRVFFAWEKRGRLSWGAFMESFDNLLARAAQENGNGSAAKRELSEEDQRYADLVKQLRLARGPGAVV